MNNVNILFFLLPKKEVEYVYDTSTIRQIIEKMEFHHYTAVPVISKEGKFVSVISAEDILFILKDNHIDWDLTMKIPLKDIKPFRDIKAISINKNIDDLVDIITNQNFVPVCDDNNYFIGIITRKSVINFLKKKL